MKIRIYQINIESETVRQDISQGLKIIQSYGYQTRVERLYELVFSGDIEANNCEDIYRKFNRVEEKDIKYLESIGYHGRSLSVTDVIELEDAVGDTHFYFCDSFGFEEIQFNKAEIMAKGDQNAR